MKVVGILQPGYMPWLGFFEQVMSSDVFIIYDDVQYDKHGWRNRNRLKGPKGPVWLTVPVLTKGRTRPLVNQVEIDPTQTKWPQKHLGTIQQLYAKSSAFGEYFPELQKIIAGSWRKLLDLDMALIELFCSWLELDTELILSSRLGIKDEDPTTRLIKILSHLKADIFYEGAAGRDYLDMDQFQKAGLKVVFQDYQPMPYPQQFDGFQPFLSVLDLLLNCGKGARSYLAGQNPPEWS